MEGINIPSQTTEIDGDRVQCVKKPNKKLKHCFICCANIDLTKINKNVRSKEVENYADMIHRCFKIQVFEFNKEIRESASICKDCIKRLRGCWAFLRDIERGLKTLCAAKYDKEINKPKVKPTAKITIPRHEKLSREMTIKNENSSHNDNELSKILQKIDKLQCVFLKKEKTSAIKKLSEDVVIKNENSPAYFVSGDKGDESVSSKRKEENKLAFSVSCDVSFGDGIDSDSNKFNKDDLFEGYQSEGSWSTNTEEIYIATGYYSTNRDIPEKPTKRDRSKEPKGMKKIIPRGCNTCPVCSRKFINRNTLVAHYAIHAPNDICYVCGKIVKRRSQYNKHLESHESKRELHLCIRCNKPFKCKNALFQHMKRIHENKLLHVCQICKERFGDSYHKRIHLRDVHGGKIKSHNCQFCNKEYVHTALLRRHLEVEHGKEKQFPCSECTKAYSSKRDLLDHMVKHTGVPINICKLCGKTFARRSSLRKHVKIHVNPK